MLDRRYTVSFECEREVAIYYITPVGKEGYEIWFGYFENLLRGCYNDTISPGGILYGYMTQTEWCDESPWKIKNVLLAKNELALFTVSKIPEMQIMLLELTEIQQRLIDLFEHALQAGYDVYIECD